MTDKHTPGNWFIDESELSNKIDPGNHTIVSDAGGVVARVVFDATDHSEADAHLIASAPDMLRALKYARNSINVCLKGGDFDLSIAKDRIDEAISKATGSEETDDD